MINAILITIQCKLFVIVTVIVACVLDDVMYYIWMYLAMYKLVELSCMQGWIQGVGG